MTITNGSPKLTKKFESWAPYLTAASNDTTATVNGKVIDNSDGSISALFATIAATDKTGTSPTVNLILQGSNDGGTNWFTVKDSGGNDIATGATSISGAGSGTTVTASIDTTQEGRTIFPGKLRFQTAVGGSSTPGWTGTVAVGAFRGNV